MPGRVSGNVANARISLRNGREIPGVTKLREGDGGAKCIAVHSRRMMIGRNASGGELSEQASYISAPRVISTYANNTWHRGI